MARIEIMLRAFVALLIIASIAMIGECHAQTAQKPDEAIELAFRIVQLRVPYVVRPYSAYEWAELLRLAADTQRTPEQVIERALSIIDGMMATNYENAQRAALVFSTMFEPPQGSTIKRSRVDDTILEFRDNRDGSTRIVYWPIGFEQGKPELINPIPHGSSGGPHRSLPVYRLLRANCQIRKLLDVAPQTFDVLPAARLKAIERPTPVLLMPVTDATWIYRGLAGPCSEVTAHVIDESGEYASVRPPPVDTPIRKYTSIDVVRYARAHSHPCLFAVAADLAFVSERFKSDVDQRELSVGAVVSIWLLPEGTLIGGSAQIAETIKPFARGPFIDKERELLVQSAMGKATAAALASIRKVGEVSSIRSSGKVSVNFTKSDLPRLGDAFVVVRGSEWIARTECRDVTGNSAELRLIAARDAIQVGDIVRRVVLPNSIGTQCFDEETPSVDVWN